MDNEGSGRSFDEMYQIVVKLKKHVKTGDLSTIVYIRETKRRLIKKEFEGLPEDIDERDLNASMWASKHQGHYLVFMDRLGKEEYFNRHKNEKAHIMMSVALENLVREIYKQHKK